MKLPIVSRKKYDILKNSYKVLNEARLELSKAYQESQIANNKLGNAIEKYDLDLKESKKEIDNLKRLLTKNGIKYKKEKSDK